MNSSIEPKWPMNFATEIVGTSLGGSGLSTYAICLEAWRRGLQVKLGPDELRYFSVSDGIKTVKFDASRPESSASSDVYASLGRKIFVTTELRKKNISTAKGGTVSNLEDALALADQVGFPVVLKPETGSMGQGVLTNLAAPEELKEAYKFLEKNFSGKAIMLEKHIFGDDYRILVVGKNVVGAVRRIPANVLGDGESSISKLITEKNQTRKQNPFLSSGRIVVDFEVEKCLRDQGKTLDEIPRKNEKIYLRRVANASAGGDVEDVTDTLSQTIKSAAIRSVQCFPSLVIAGVDFIIDDHKSELSEFSVLEINTRPHIGVNMYPTSGIGREAPKAIIDEFFPSSEATVSDARLIRFDPKSIINILQEGKASEVRLPDLPSHLFPFRSRMIFKNQKGSEIKKFYQPRINRIAKESGISGFLKRYSNGNVEIVVGARSKNDLTRLMAELAKYTEKSPVTERPWLGVLTIGFDIIQ
ncbi:ATP-binding protein [Glutamicibacter sp. AOP5-A2-7]